MEEFKKKEKKKNLDFFFFFPLEVGRGRATKSQRNIGSAEISHGHGYLEARKSIKKLIVGYVGKLSKKKKRKK